MQRMMDSSCLGVSHIVCLESYRSNAIQTAEHGVGEREEYNDEPRSDDTMGMETEAKQIFSQP